MTRHSQASRSSRSKTRSGGSRQSNLDIESQRCLVMRLQVSGNDQQKFQPKLPYRSYSDGNEHDEYDQAQSEGSARSISNNPPSCPSSPSPTALSHGRTTHDFLDPTPYEYPPGQQYAYPGYTYESPHDHGNGNGTRTSNNEYNYSHVGGSVSNYASNNGGSVGNRNGVASKSSGIQEELDALASNPRAGWDSNPDGDYGAADEYHGTYGR